ERSQELRDGGADIASTEDAEGSSLLARRIPSRHVGDADGERAARNADAECGNEHLWEGLGIGEEPGGHGRREHDHRVDPPAAVLIRPNAQDDADQRSGENRGSDEKPELGFAQPQFIFYLDSDNRKYGPDGEADGKRYRRKPERLVLLGHANACSSWHMLPLRFAVCRREFLRTVSAIDVQRH